MEALLRLHTAQWNAKGKEGMIEANNSGAFLRDVTRRFAERDMVRIFTLSCDSNFAAILLAFVYDGKIFGYLTGSDRGYQSYRLASLLLRESLKYACEQRFRAWNFCRGDEVYKSEWGACLIPRCRLLIHNSR
jgi:CelD/BcsL family acetyltransferase involved in cellulose biosynthesis